MTARRALIVGMGIAGMSAALALHKAGWTSLIVERADARRRQGYFIGLFPPGRKAAQALGVYEDIPARTPDGVNWELRADGRRSTAPGFLDQPGQPASVLRGDIEAALWKHIDGKVEVMFSTSPTEITDNGDRVLVTLQNSLTGASSVEEVDLVVGADGMRSTVRKMVFGPDEQFMKSLGAMICAYEFRNQVPGYRQEDGAAVCEPRRALWVFPFSDRSPAALFTYRTKDIDAQFTRPPVEVLRKHYEGMCADGVLDYAIEELKSAEHFLFDSVHHVKMDQWSKGRVVLVGDAAWSLTLYSGMGASMGLKGGEELGRQLERHHGEIGAALAAWEKALRPMVRREQLLAYVKREGFVPSNTLTAWIRRTAFKVIVHFSKNRKHPMKEAEDAMPHNQPQPAANGAPPCVEAGRTCDDRAKLAIVGLAAALLAGLAVTGPGPAYAQPIGPGPFPGPAMSGPAMPGPPAAFPPGPAGPMTRSGPGVPPAPAPPLAVPLPPPPPIALLLGPPLPPAPPGPFQDSLDHRKPKEQKECRLRSKHFS